MLSRRFLKFHQTLQKSSKTSIRFLSQLSSENLRTSYGQNLKNIADLVKVRATDLECKMVTDIRYFRVPEAQQWRVAVVKDLLEVRWNILEIDVMNDQKELDAIIEALCVT